MEDYRVYDCFSCKRYFVYKEGPTTLCGKCKKKNLTECFVCGEREYTSNHLCQKHQSYDGKYHKGKKFEVTYQVKSFEVNDEEDDFGYINMNVDTIKETFKIPKYFSKKEIENININNEKIFTFRKKTEYIDDIDIPSKVYRIVDIQVV